MAKRERATIITIFLCLALCAGLPAQDERRDGKLALGAALEWNMNARKYFAGGAALGFDYSLPRSLAVGLSANANTNFAALTALELAALFRWYFLSKNRAGLFLQADAGALFYMGREQPVPFFLGGLRTGCRFPLGASWYIEPYARGGYPFVFSVGAAAGARLKPAKKRGRAVAVAVKEAPEKIARDIAEEITRMEIPNVSVRVEDEGITISMFNIQFQPDSAVLPRGEREKLDKLFDILRQYEDRDILVSGHTALAGTAEGRRQVSTERAAVVAAYIIAQKVRPSERVIVHGYGAERPLGDNSTEAGRSQNRRVDITILENQIVKQ